MRTDLDHLPPSKQRDLAHIVRVIFEEFEAATRGNAGKQARILKLVLYGSYARGDWVDDPIGGYKSDYDILVIVNYQRLTDFADGAGVAAGPTWRRHLGRLVPRPLYRLLFNLALSSHGGFCTVSRQWDKAGDEPVLRMIRGIQPVFTHWRDLWFRHVPFYHVRALREWQRRVEREGLEPYRLAEA